MKMRDKIAKNYEKMLTQGSFGCIIEENLTDFVHTIV